MEYLFKKAWEYFDEPMYAADQEFLRKVSDDYNKQKETLDTSLWNNIDKLTTAYIEEEE